MFEKELKSLLNNAWNDDEKRIIKTLLDNLTYYKKLIPSSLKQDITIALQMCNTFKNELETYRQLCKCNCINKDCEKDKCNCEKDKCNCEKDKCNCEKDKCNCEKDKCNCEKDKCNCEKDKCNCEII